MPPLGLNSFIFMQFLAKIWQNNRLTHPPRELKLPSVGSPGSATAFACNVSDIADPLFRFKYILGPFIFYILTRYNVKVKWQVKYVRLSMGGKGQLSHVHGKVTYGPTYTASVSRIATV